MSDSEKPKSWREIITNCFVSIDRKCKPAERHFDQCAILNILGHLGRPVAFVSIIVGMFVYVRGFDERQMQAENQRKATHYQAWQIIKAAQGQRSSGGRVEALQDLNNDKVSLACVDLSKAYLLELNLENANLTEANLSDANFPGADLSDANLNKASLSWTGLVGADLSNVNLTNAHLLSTDLTGADLSGANLNFANLNFADLTGADLSGANLTNIKNWRGIKRIEQANIYDVNYPPDGFIEWATKHGAVSIEDNEKWKKLLLEKKMKQEK